MIKTFQRILTVAVLSSTALGLAGCSSLAENPGHPPINAMQQELAQSLRENQKLLKEQQSRSAVPTTVQQALLPSLSVPATSEHPLSRRFDVSANAIPAAAFFNSLVQDTSYNIIVSPSVTGNITLHLKDVTIPEVMAAVEATYGYRYKQEAYGYRVYPTTLETRIYRVNYLDIDRSADSTVSVQSGFITQQNNNGGSTASTSNGATTTSSGSNSGSGSGNSSTITSKSQMDFWEQLKLALIAIIGDKDGHRVLTDSASGMVVLRGTPDELSEARLYLDRVNKIMSREILIQAEILKVTLNKDFDAGIEWSLLGASQAGNVSNSSHENTALSAFTPIFTLGGSLNKLSAAVSLLETQGNVQVLSSPRVTAMNNQKALVKIGQEKYYVTNATSSTIAGSTSTTSQGIDMEPFFSGIALAVTPMITGRDGVMMQIHPIISSVSEHKISVTLNNSADEIESAKSDIDESDNMVFAHSGQIIVVSGLRENSTGESLGKTPWLGNIPVIGALFRRTNQTSTRKELVILIKPTIINNGLWVKALKEETKRYQNVKEDYHLGGYPKRFGNKGEVQSFDDMFYHKPTSAEHQAQSGQGGA